MNYDKKLAQQIQRAVGTRPDGVIGNETLKAIASKLGVNPTQELKLWPTDTFREMEAFYGPHGDISQTVLITPPYQLFSDGLPVKVLRVHKKIAQPVEYVLNQVLKVYGKEIHDLKLDIYDGCFNDRPKRGGTSWSVHAYAAALDFAADYNQLNWDHTRALFAQPQYEDWFKIWESVGAVSLGRECDFDYMHVQFASIP